MQFGRLPGIYGRKEVYDMCFKFSWLKALKISLDASVYRDLGFSEDESFSFALTDNSSSVKGAAAISPEKLRAIKEAGKKRERELAALEQRQRKTREENPWYMRKQKNSVKKPPKGAKKQERRTVNLFLLRWYAYLSPLRFWAILLTSNQKKSDPERPGFFGQGSPAKTGGRFVLPFSAY